MGVVPQPKIRSEAWSAGFEPSALEMRGGRVGTPNSRCEASWAKVVRGISVREGTLRTTAGVTCRSAVRFSVA